MITIVNITKEEFKKYEVVRDSGVTNMFDFKVVTAKTGLSKDQCKTIINNYSELTKKYPEVREELDEKWRKSHPFPK